MPSDRDITVLVQQLSHENPKIVREAFLGLVDCYYKVPNASKVISQAGGVASTLSAMRRFPMEPKIQAFGCTLVQIQMDRNDGDSKRAVVNAGGVPLVVAALHRFPHVDICREQACICLYLLASVDSNGEVKAGAISAINKAVQVSLSKNDYGTLEPATGCLAILSSESAHRRVLFDSVPILIRILKQACESSVSSLGSSPVAVSCLFTLSNVAHEADAPSLIVRNKGVEATINTMRLCGDCDQLISPACVLLSSLLEDNREAVRQAIVQTGGIPVLMKAAKHMVHDWTSIIPTELPLQTALVVLADVALASNDNVVAIQKAGVVALLVSVLNKYNGDERLMINVMSILWRFVFINVSLPESVVGGVSTIVSEVFHEGGHEAILAAMKQHADSGAIQRAGCMLLAGLSSKNGEPNRVVSAGGIPVLDAAKERHSNDAEVQKWADVALDSMNDVTRCHMCNKMSGTFKACSRCKLTTYCSRACQRSHWNSGHKAACNAALESAAETARRRADCGSSLEAQDKILRLNGDKADYYIFLPSGDVEGIQFGNAFQKACFNLIRSRAPSSPYCVWRLYAMLKQSSERDERTANNLPLIRRQLQAEYNVDPVSAHDAPQIGEITEEDFEQIQQSLGGGDEERRLLSLLPQAGPALEKQNKLLEEFPETLYYVFDSPPFAIATSNKRNSECFKIVRKRAPISPRCLEGMYDFLIGVVDANLSSVDEGTRRRVHNVIRRQLETEYGRDPVDSGGNQDDEVCNDAANYVNATMVLGSNKS